jgi:hypothetical protein
MTRRIVGIDEASSYYGLSKEALRKRIKRGSIEATKDHDGRWTVVIEDGVQAGRQENSQDLYNAFVQELKERIEEQKEYNKFLIRQVDQKDDQLLRQEKRLLLLEAGKASRKGIKWPWQKTEDGENWS